jgi:hypothetical protein
MSLYKDREPSASRPQPVNRDEAITALLGGDSYKRSLDH